MASSQVHSIRDLFYWRFAYLYVAADGKEAAYGLMTWMLKGFRSGEHDWEQSIRKFSRLVGIWPRCAYCRSPAAVRPVRIIDIAELGAPWSANTVPMCRECEGAKAGRSLFRWKGKKGVREIPPEIESRALALLFRLHEEAGTLDIGREDIERRLCPTCPSSADCGRALLDVWCVESVLGLPGVAATETRTVRDFLYWAYANYGMARAAMNDGAEAYNELHEHIRRELYTGLMKGNKSISSFFKDERLKMELPQRCWYCGAAGKLSADHLLPRSRGGPDTGMNLSWACQSCNSSKGAKDLLEWWASRSSESLPMWLLRRYLKLATAWCEEHGKMDSPLAEVLADCPYSLRLIPVDYAAPSQLRTWIVEL